MVPADDVVELPDRLSFEQGAAIPVNYATAWAALIGYGNLQPGERVLVHSAGGGVGIAATQIAKRYGAEVFGTASPSKHERCREIGVDRALDYTRPGWEKGIGELRHRPGRGRRQELPNELRPALARAAGWSRSAPPRSSPASAKTSLRRSKRCCGCRAST